MAGAVTMMMMMGAPIGFQQIGPTLTLAPMVTARPRDALRRHGTQRSSTHVSTYATPAGGHLIALVLATFP
jgi:hypothetical protein